MDLCETLYPACELPEVQATPGNPFSGCAVPPMRSVSVSDNQAGGDVSATWSGLADPIVEGGNGNALQTEDVTFTAAPDSGFYVMEWTGDCDGVGATGGDDAGTAIGEDKTCVVSGGANDISAGAVFAEVRAVRFAEPVASDGGELRGLQFRPRDGGRGGRGRRDGEMPAGVGLLLRGRGGQWDAMCLRVRIQRRRVRGL